MNYVQRTLRRRRQFVATPLPDKLFSSELQSCRFEVILPARSRWDMSSSIFLGERSTDEAAANLSLAILSLGSSIAGANESPRAETSTHGALNINRKGASSLPRRPLRSRKVLSLEQTTPAEVHYSDRCRRLRLHRLIRLQRLRR